VLIFRYLAKEVFITLASLTTILLLIFMSNQFIQYLNRAANGQIPGMLLMKLMMLEMPTLLVLLLPLGFYAALLVAYGRLYAESEMIVLQACGYGPRKLLMHSYIMAFVVTVVVLVIMLWGSPMIMVERARLLRTTGIQTLIQTIVPGRFQTASGGKQIFYVEKMNRDHSLASNVFLARFVQKNEESHWDVLWAENAFAETDPGTNEDYVILERGKEYQGTPGRADFQTAQFERFKARLPHPTVEVKGDIRTLKMTELWPMNNSDLSKVAEIQWRFSIPIMVLTLTLVAVPLSRVNPRAGKYAKLLPAMVLYIVYANMMFIARDWLAAGKIPTWIGMWWPHLIVVILGLLLLYRNQKKPA